VPTLIAAETLIGIGSSAQLCFNYAIVELVPLKYRFLANGFAFCWLILPNGFGSVISYSFIYQTSVGWRGVFYLLIALNTVCTACWFFFYHPPTFDMKHGEGRRKEFIKNFDYVGTLLSTMGQLLFLMGLSWGGSLHPWKSAEVITTVVLGFLLIVAFFLWEAYAPLKE
jgi:MFS family permease